MVTYKKLSSGDNSEFYQIFGPVFASRQIRNEFEGYPLSNEDNWLWIAGFEEKELVGFIALEPIKKGFHIHATYVIPTQRRKGILKELITRAVKATFGAEITVTIRDYLEPVYTRAGFVITGRKGKKWLNLRRDKDA